MLQVLLLILKIIGIILLSILGLFLILGLLGLFVPLRYRGKGIYDENQKSACVRITWLFHIISLKIYYDEGKADGILRIFGIRFFQYSKPKVKKVKKARSRRQKNNVANEVSMRDDIVVAPTPINLNDNLVPEGISVNESKSEDKQPRHKSLFYKIHHFFQNIRYTIKNLYDKIKKIIEKIDYYKRLWELDSTQEAISYIKTRSFRFLNHIKPRKLQGQVIFGFDDPATTGKILGYISMFYPVYGKNISVIPDFENKVFESKLYFRGRIRAFTVLKIGVPIMLNKNLKRFLNRLKP